MQRRPLGECFSSTDCSENSKRFQESLSDSSKVTARKQQILYKKGLSTFVSSSKQPPEVFFRKRCSQRLRKNSQENTCARNSFNKVAGLKSANLLKKSPWLKCFPVNFVKFSKNNFCYKTPLVDASLLRILPKNNIADIPRNIWKQALALPKFEVVLYRCCFEILTET